MSWSGLRLDAATRPKTAQQSPFFTQRVGAFRSLKSALGRAKHEVALLGVLFVFTPGGVIARRWAEVQTCLNLIGEAIG